MSRLGLRVLGLEEAHHAQLSKYSPGACVVFRTWTEGENHGHGSFDLFGDRYGKLWQTSTEYYHSGIYLPRVLCIVQGSWARVICLMYYSLAAPY